MKEIILATTNVNKLIEIQELIKDQYKLLSLDDIGFSQDIPEDQLTIEGNARQKARYLYELFKIDCIADDTGLEVEALDRQPGVFSARFAELTGEIIPGEEVSDSNIRKLLNLLRDIENRNAQFRTIIAYITKKNDYLFEGKVEGKILKEKRGSSGFGYDPVFQPKGCQLTFAEMSLEQKNKISHRAMAVQKLVEFLTSRT